MHFQRNTRNKFALRTYQFNEWYGIDTSSQKWKCTVSTATSGTTQAYYWQVQGQNSSISLCNGNAFKRKI